MMEIELINAGKCEVKLNISGNFKKILFKTFHSWNQNKTGLFLAKHICQEI